MLKNSWVYIAKIYEIMNIYISVAAVSGDEHAAKGGRNGGVQGHTLRRHQAHNTPTLENLILPI